MGYSKQHTHFDWRRHDMTVLRLKAFLGLGVVAILAWLLP